MFPVEDTKFGGMKYAGISRAAVIDNVDPDKKGRVRVITPLFGESNWIPYLKQAGFFGVPDKGDVVYVTTDGGKHTYLVAFGNLTCGPENETLPEDFTRMLPSNRGMYSPKGHLIELDDGTTLIKTGSGIRLTTASGSKIHIVDDPTAPSTTIERAEGQKIVLDGLTDKIEMEVSFGDKISISAAQGLQGSTPSGTSFSFKSGEIKFANNSSSATMTAAGDIELVGPTASIKAAAAGDIELTGPTASVKMGASGKIEAKGPTASLIISESGQVELKGAAAGVVELLVEAFTALSTQTAPGFGAPTSTVAKFAELMAKAQSIKAS